MHEKTWEIVYQIDQSDLLVSFNDQWNEFATNNDGTHLTGEKIAKFALWDFIHDAETRHLHEVLLKRARTQAKAICNLPFRCDAPTLRRFMEMDITPLSDGYVEYRCRSLRTEPRERVVLTTADERDTGHFLRMCSWCKKIDVQNDTWREVEDAIKLLGLFSGATMPPISHTMCSVCLDQLVEGD